MQTPTEHVAPLSEGARSEVTAWLEDVAEPLAGLAADAPASDLHKLVERARAATVVGMGAGTRGAHEVSCLQLRMVAALVRHLGFRTVALDEDWTLGVELDRYVREGTGDLAQLLGGAGGAWRTEEMHQLLTWVREHNAHRPEDPVRLLGVNVREVRDWAYDAVVDHVQAVAPDRSSLVRQWYTGLRPGADIAEHVRRFRASPDRAECVTRAAAARDLVLGLPARTGEEQHAFAVHAAEAILSFYRLHADGKPGEARYMARLERCLADNVIRWYDLTGKKVVLWSALTHTADGPTRAVRFPPAPPRRQANAGSHLRSRFGDGYLSVGLTFHSGRIASFAGGPHQVPEAAGELAESVLGTASPDMYLLDLEDTAGGRPAPVSAWLDGPAAVRVIGPHYDPDADGAHHMTGGSLSAWFDLLVHLRHVTPSRPLG
ncbi:erythromycin esterase family protein [Streptomyces sp. NPDC059740]|uniref:erythromycin esterase family protein n=1 Tax=Streptomyces sp. NPDC059740 TaxID=3346926 RepID=UPI0036463C89